MEEFLKDKVDVGLLLAQELRLTPGDYSAAAGWPNLSYQDEQDVPAAWPGHMAFKVLEEPVPVQGREYAPEEADYFWVCLQRLAPQLDPRMRDDLLNRRPSYPLYFDVKRLVNKAGVFTVTGRLRARATYSAKRNSIFQGAASDGAKLALYRLWRAGLAIVAFIHDEVVVEVDAGADLAAVKKQIDDILIGAMREVCPDLAIEVEGTFRRRWGKDKAAEIPVRPGSEMLAAPPA